MKSYQNPFSTIVNRFGFSLLCVVGGTLFFSCADDDDLPSPRIFIETPSENAIVFSVDTVAVKARITHGRGIESVSVELTDADFNPVGTKETFPASGTEVDFSTFYVTNDPLRSSGIHHIAVRASDGSKTGSAFKRVQLSAVPRVLERILVAVKSTNNVRIFQSAEGQAPLELLSRTMDCRGAALNYRQNILALAGGEIGDLEFYETANFTLLAGVPGLGTASLPYFLDVRYSRDFEEMIALQRDPRLRAFDKRAQPATGFPLKTNHLPSAVFAVNDRYYVNESPISLPNQILSVYARPGLLLASLETTGPVKGVFRRNDFEVFLWENHPEGLKLRVMSTESQFISDVFQREGEQLIDVAEMDTGIFGVLTDQGLYRYNYNTGSTVVVLSDVQGTSLDYEGLSQTFFIAAGNVLTRIDQGGNVVAQEIYPGPVFRVNFDYNR